MVGLSAEFMKALYMKAKVAFNECIIKEENRFLQDEIDVPLGTIIPIEEFIKFQFSKLETNSFVVEVKLRLICQGGNLIGSYSYYENESGVPVDDSLVFD